MGANSDDFGGDTHAQLVCTLKAVGFGEIRTQVYPSASTNHQSKLSGFIEELIGKFGPAEVSYILAIVSYHPHSLLILIAFQRSEDLTYRTPYRLVK